ncbi:MAG: 3-oxoacyl-[acyl-carrier-protein] synthase III C-terminal domain-containing protein, partial [Myxococcota bacterium]
FESFAKHSDLLRSGIEWLGDEAPRFGARNANVRDEDPRFLEHSIDCAEQTASRLLAAHGVELADVDLVIPSQFPPAFPAAFRTRLGLPSERVVDATQTHGATYTAGPALAFASALDAGRAREGARVLFLGVGAGITVAAALCTLSSGGTARRSA